ncbi:hypothetical protein HSX11_01760 [Oxalobacteraceae bacterium]|nr:hypothetical protein [Oxalobacteraceae bacterium]
MMRALLMVMGLLAMFSAGAAPPLPGAAAQLLPTLGAEVDRFWPALAPRAFVAGVIEQESNWKIGAKLQTARELGAGLGQFTRAYAADGSLRFDALEETKRLDPSLAAWSWRDPYRAEYQLRGVVLKLRANNRACAPLMTDSREALACAAAQYNGGAGSVSKRIRLCRVTSGCDPGRWFGHLEHRVVQSTARVAGYGESFAEINSKYPGRVFARMQKYEGRL